MLKDSNLLSALRDEDLAALVPHMSRCEFRAGELLYEPGDIVEYCYFPAGPAIASFYVLLESGVVVETVMIGREGALGGVVSHGKLPSYARSTVTHDGPFYRIAVSDLKKVQDERSTIGDLLARYGDCLMAQVFQSIACNAIHTIEQRAAKWLTAAVERTGKNDITMTQEQLASMMGIGRSYASRVVQRFKQAGLVQTRRGGIKVLEQDRLKQRACDCNELVHSHFRTVLAGVYPD